MTTTYENITNEQIRALRDEAVKAGDVDMVTTCDDALGGSQTARAECVRAIRDAEAMA